MFRVYYFPSKKLLQLCLCDIYCISTIVCYCLPEFTTKIATNVSLLFYLIVSVFFYFLIVFYLYGKLKETCDYFKFKFICIVLFMIQSLQSSFTGITFLQ